MKSLWQYYNKVSLYWGSLPSTGILLQNNCWAMDIVGYTEDFVKFEVS